jgi:hypothetical protein
MADQDQQPLEVNDPVEQPPVPPGRGGGRGGGAA